jgi:hypothetical protein
VCGDLNDASQFEGVAGWSLSDYDIPGTYKGGLDDTLVVTDVPTPEPSTFGLMLLGLGFVLAMRKRIAPASYRPSERRPRSCFRPMTKNSSAPARMA